MTATLPRRGAAILALVLLQALPLSAALAQRRVPDAVHERLAPRERVPLTTGWRFHRGDPPGAEDLLRYAPRPESTTSVDGRVADAEPEAATRVAGEGGLRRWILPTANPFIRDPAARHARPPGDPGGDLPFVQADFDDSGWRVVRVPHDWAIEGPFLTEGPTGGMGRLKTWGPVWYRRTIEVGAADAARRHFLDVDGAMSHATVWLNGRLVGGWPYGYNAWRLDLTPVLRPGARNQLAIRLDNPPESARWYPGAGLYRPVWLTRTDALHVDQWGTVVRTPQVSEARARVEVEVTVRNAGDTPATLDVHTRFHALDPDGRRSARPLAALAPQRLTVPAGGTATASGSTTILKPRLWGPRPTQVPNRHLAVTTLVRDGRVVDRYETRFGIRSLHFDPERGLHVNGRPVPLRGVNQHHDLGALGAAFSVRAAERQLELLQAMGTNAVRMAHNPPASGLLELTDRLGLLVIDEIFDVWERRKTPLDFHLLFPDWHEPDLRAMLRRDRHHPSVIAWSIGNEVGEQYTGEAGAAIARRLHAIVREEDPTRPTTTAMNWAKPDMPLPAVVDLLGLNYQGEGIRQAAEFEGTDRIRTPPQYAAFHARFPDKLVLGTETASALSSRGVYLFPVTPESSSPVRDGRGGDARIAQVSGYELHAVDFGSSADKVFATLDRHPFVAGEFVWTGFDYLGEPTPYYSARSSYSGILDLAGLKKDRFHLYRSRWRPDEPMAHLLPHWTWPERVGQVTPVHVFTSGDAGELFVNGRSQGWRRKGPGEYRLRWDAVVHEPGELKVVTTRLGRPWATAVTRTAGEAVRLELQADRRRLRGTGDDLAFVTVRVTDAAGRTVPRAAQRIRFVVEGAGELLATDNGDPTSFEPFPSPEREAFGGLALAIVRARPGGGAITVRAQADGLVGGAVALRADRR